MPVTLSQSRIYRNTSPSPVPSLVSLPEELSPEGFSSDDGWSDMGNLNGMKRGESIVSPSDTGTTSTKGEDEGERAQGGLLPADYYRDDTPPPTLSIQDQLTTLTQNFQASQAILLDQLRAQSNQITSLHTFLTDLQKTHEQQTYEQELKRKEKAQRKDKDKKVQQTPIHPLRPPPGISVEKVADLATALASGEKDSSQAVEEMLGWLEGVNAPFGTGLKEGRDELEPMVRVGNLEGVLDVTLGRVGKMEIDVQGMKREWRELRDKGVGDGIMAWDDSYGGEARAGKKVRGRSESRDSASIDL